MLVTLKLLFMTFKVEKLMFYIMDGWMQVLVMSFLGMQAQLLVVNILQ